MEQSFALSQSPVAPSPPRSGSACTPAPDALVQLMILSIRYDYENELHRLVVRMPRDDRGSELVGELNPVIAAQLRAIVPDTRTTCSSDDSGDLEIGAPKLLDLPAGDVPTERGV